MDINMPKLNGIEATRVITHELPEISVVGLSMHDSKEVYEAMLAAGAVTCLPKDGPSSDLFEAISRCNDAAV